MNDGTNTRLEKMLLEESLNQEFVSTLGQRVERYLKLKPHAIIPNAHFATVSAECHFLYRDGHFYGTISLAQSVAEALVRFLCEKSGWKAAKEFEKNLKQLETRKIVSTDLASLFLEIWVDRDDYHHLNPKIEQDRQRLESLATNKLTALKKVEEELFAYTVNEGRLVPRYAKYWDQGQGEGTVSVFLRLE